MYVPDVLTYVYQILSILIKNKSLFIGLLIGGGVAIYPHGWTSMEVQQACGNLSGSYKFGKLSLPKHTSPHLLINFF